jgi:high-affinity iron transporter
MLARLRHLAATVLLAFALVPAMAAADTDYAAVTGAIATRGDAALAAYDPARPELAASEFSLLYFEVFEASGMEFALNQQDNGLMLAIELRFGQLIRQSMKGEPKPVLAATWSELHPLLEQGAQRLGAAPAANGFVAAAMQAALIVLREGAEAMLVIAALATYLRRSGQHGHLAALWTGVGAALAASLATAWAFSTLLAGAGAARELIEGACLLAAAALLAWVSLWIYSRREAQQWQAYLKDQAAAAIATDSGWAMGATAFLAVYREGAETVLFLQALTGGNAPAGAVGAGAAAAALVLAAAWFALRGSAMRLPIKPFFTATAALLFALALSFAGKGVVELQVAGWADVTRLAGAPEWPLLGVFPTVETLGTQVALLGACLLAVMAARRRTRTATA